jgi:hypothetical protein
MASVSARKNSTDSSALHDARSSKEKWGHAAHACGDAEQQGKQEHTMQCRFVFGAARLWLGF